MMTYNTMIVLLGVGLLGAAAGPVGSFAVLRRQSLMGDALAHAALPGLCLGFLLIGQRNLAVMLVGAFASGLLGIATVSALTHWTRVRKDAAIGIVLSVFFGAGIVLARLIQNMTTAIGSKAGLDSYILGKTAGIVAADVALIAGAALSCLAIVFLMFKEFLLVSFDFEFGRVQGWPARRIDLAITALVAIIVVIGLPAVGVVMIAAMLIMPGVAARFWTDRLSHLIWLAVGFGVGMGLIGTVLSATFDKMPAGPIITLVGAAFFMISALTAPHRGLVARWLSRRSHARRADTTEMLRIIYEHEELKANCELQQLQQSKSWSTNRVRQLLAELIRNGEVKLESTQYRLTQAGRLKAVEGVRRHRFWELLVSEYPDLVPQARPLTDDPIDDSVAANVVDELIAQLREAGKWPELRLGEIS